MRVRKASSSEHINLSQECGKLIIKPQKFGMVSGHQLSHLLEAGFVQKPWWVCSCQIQLVSYFLENVSKKSEQRRLSTSVGIVIEIHRLAGSTHTVPGTVIAQWDVKKLTNSRIPLSMASGGISTACLITLHP